MKWTPGLSRIMRQIVKRHWANIHRNNLSYPLPGLDHAVKQLFTRAWYAEFLIKISLYFFREVLN